MKVLTADDHWLFRAGLKRLLRRLDRQIEMLEAESFDEAIEIIERTDNLDLIILDLLMPDMPAFEGLAAMRAKAPHAPIVVLSMIDDRHDILHTINMGALGFIPKTAKPDEIVKALKLVLSGDVYLPASVIRRGEQHGTATGRGVPRAASASAAASKLRLLTKRQRDVVELLAQGKTNAEIARDLSVSENTARLHVSVILKKLELSNRTQVALLATQTRGYSVAEASESLLGRPASLTEAE
jgi:DNA-binding NarL/FixJ family response regulator